MSILRSTSRTLTALALGALCLVTALAAVTVTDIKVGKQGADLTLSYRLNQAATSVNIQVGAQSFAGPTAKGLNTATVPGTLAGQTATITATAPAIAGAGGAEVIVPFTQDASSNRITGIDVVTRTDSAYKGRIFLAAGFGQPSQKYLWSYYGDGTFAAKKDLTTSGYTSASFPYGMSLVQGDVNDRIAVQNRTGARLLLYNPDLSLAFDLDGRYCTPGSAVTQQYDTSGTQVANGLNSWIGGNNADGGVVHDTYDLSATSTLDNGNTTATRTAVDAIALSAAASGDRVVQSIAIDPRNRVMYANQSGAAHTVAAGHVAKFDSSDFGTTWVEDTTWNANLAAAIGADSAGVSLGIAKDKGFSADNLSASWVWVCVSGSAGPASLNKIYRVNAATGAIDAAATIDLKSVAVPAESTTITDKAGHFLSVDAAGNIVLTVGNTANTNATHWGVLAPNTAGPTTDTVTANLIPPAYVDITVAPASVGNTGSGSFSFTATAFDPKGIVADNVQVSIDLTPIGGTVLNLTRGTVSADGLSAPYTGSYTVPTNAPLGSKDVTVTMTTAASGSPTVKTGLNLYNAYIPAWTAATTGGVTGNAANGTTAYFATDAGKVHAINTLTGAPVTTFGSAGVASVSGPAGGRLLLAAGRLYVITPTGVDILSSGRGTKLGTAALPNAVDVAMHPGDPSVVYVSSGNVVYKVNAATGAPVGQSADLGARANKIAIGSAVAGGGSWVLVVGTEGDTAGVNGKCYMLDPVNLTDLYPPLSDPNGPVRGRAAFVELSASPVFGIGSFSGLAGIDATTGQFLPWVAGGGGGANVGGNPYLTSAPVLADIAVSAATEPTPRFFVATAGSDTSGGQILIINVGDGQRPSYGGFPVQLTATGSGFAAGAGLLAHYGDSLVDASVTRPLYIGANGTAKQFFGLETLPDSVEYNASAQKRHIYDPTDTITFPGAVAGSFDNVPSESGARIVVGSSAGLAYAFPALTVTKAAAVTGITPANGVDGVSTSANITLTFDKDISALFIDNTIVKLIDQSGVEVPASLTPGTTTIVIDPDATLTTSRYYSVIVASVVDQFQPFSSIFYVGTLPSVQWDVNKDGAFNADDVKATLSVAGGLLNATAIDKAQADANGDGQITLADADLLDRKLNGK